MQAKEASFRNCPPTGSALRRGHGAWFGAPGFRLYSDSEPTRAYWSRLLTRMSALAAAGCIGLTGAASAADKTDKGAEKKGGVYKCVAASGAVTYSTSPCKGVKREFLTDKELKKKSNTMRLPKPRTEYPVYPDSPASRPVPVPAPAASAPGQPAAVTTPMGTIIHDPDIGR